MTIFLFNKKDDRQAPQNMIDNFSIMDEIAKRKAQSVLTTYFAAAGFVEGSQTDIFLTKAMIETGPQLKFKKA